MYTPSNVTKVIRVMNVTPCDESKNLLMCTLEGAQRVARELTSSRLFRLAFNHFCKAHDASDVTSCHTHEPTNTQASVNPSQRSVNYSWGLVRGATSSTPCTTPRANNQTCDEKKVEIPLLLSSVHRFEHSWASWLWFTVVHDVTYKFNGGPWSQ